ncbi:hypothetical protein [Flavobacterium rhamnosiphilum]|nr:hypothetical protein [Flavobacterium rhamnosiphilum]
MLVQIAIAIEMDARQIAPAILISTMRLRDNELMAFFLRNRTDSHS